jgi:hypothetical protein
MLKGYKTFIVNGAALIFGLIFVIVPEAELPSSDEVGVLVDQADVVLSQGQGIALALWSALQLILRKVTDSSLFSSE